MEAPAVEVLRAACLQAPKADLPSLPSRRRQYRPSSSTITDEILGGQMPCCPQGDAGQSGQEDRWRRWGQEPHSQPAIGPGPAPDATFEDTPRSPGLDSQAWQSGTATAWHSDLGEPRQPNAGAACPGTRMGGSIRAKQLWVPTRTLHP